MRHDGCPAEVIPEQEPRTEPGAGEGNDRGGAQGTELVGRNASEAIEPRQIVESVSAETVYKARRQQASGNQTEATHRGPRARHVSKVGAGTLETLRRLNGCSCTEQARKGKPVPTPSRGSQIIS